MNSPEFPRREERGGKKERHERVPKHQGQNFKEGVRMKTKD